MGFKNSLREYFTFNRRERNGVFVLFAIIIALILYLSFSNLFYRKEPIDFSKFDKEISEFEVEQKRVGDSVVASGKDLVFSGNHLVDSKYDHTGYKKEIIIVEINSADTTELKRIKGIGSVFAKRIVKFRDALGGFIKKDQLLEVYGFDKEKMEEVSSQIRLDSLSVKKLNINIASVDDLNNHPYINKKQAVAIFTKRVKAGDYKDLRELKKLDVMSDSLFAKILPYLTVK